MCKKLFRAFPGDPKLRGVFIRVFGVVFAAGLVGSAVVAYATRPIFFSISRLEVIPDADGARFAQKNKQWHLLALDSQCRIISSLDYAEKVTMHLNLQHVLASQVGEPDWPVIKAAWELREKVNVTHMTGTNVITISVQNSDPVLAAAIANSLAGFHREYCLRGWEDAQWSKSHTPSGVSFDTAYRVNILEAASPNRGSVVRTKLEIFLMWALGGTLVALLAGGGGALISLLVRPHCPAHNLPSP